MGHWEGPHASAHEISGAHGESHAIPSPWCERVSDFIHPDRYDGAREGSVLKIAKASFSSCVTAVMSSLACWL